MKTWCVFLISITSASVPTCFEREKGAKDSVVVPMNDGLVLKLAPLNTLEEAFAWVPGGRLVDSACQATVKLVSRPPSRMKRMVCHDLGGNYHDDAYFQGSGASHYYEFWDWRSIDVFVYFSHCMITIPPVGWTNAGHKNGVKVLGTFIVEYDEGKVKAERFLKDDKIAAILVKKLVDLAVYFRFDGWLLNFEVELDYSLIPTLVNFCKSLTEEMHKAMPDSLVIWYDAITVIGELKWQNQLDKYNIDFFRDTDGILLNYQWTADTLPDDVEKAEGRSTSVYVGLDVWGRYTKEYEAFMDIPRGLKLVEDASLSVCLFAPAYSYEKFRLSAWELKDKAFWDGVTAKWGKETSVTSFPFVSTFNRGCGEAMFIDGQMVSNSSWYNMSSQDIQPNRSNEGSQELEGSFSFVTAYTGGSCYRVTGSLRGGKMEWFPLYNTAIVLENDTVQMRFTYIPSRTAKSKPGVVLVPYTSTNADDPEVQSERTPRVIICEPACESHTFTSVNEATLSMIYPGAQLEFLTPRAQNGVADLPESKKMWTTLEYDLTNVKGYMVYQLSVLNIGSMELDAETPFETFVGGLSLVPKNPAPPTTMKKLEGKILDMQAGKIGGKSLSVHLTWAADSDTTPLSHFHVYSILPRRTDWIGVAHTNEFFVTQFELPSLHDKAIFCVQPVSMYGFSQSLDESAYISLALTETPDTAIGFLRSKLSMITNTQHFQSEIFLGAAVALLGVCLLITFGWQSKRV